MTTSTDDGVAFSLFRHTIAASDLSGTVYAYSDEVDLDLANFDLKPEGKDMLSWLSQFKATNSAIKVLGSIWSPPGWMKLNGVMDGTTTDNNLNHKYDSQFAQYFVKYIQAFKEGGVDVDAITIQNEPLNSQAGYPTMYVAADESTSLIQNNIGPALKAAGLETEIWAYDHNTGKNVLLYNWTKIANNPRCTCLPTGRSRRRRILRQYRRLALLRSK